MCLDQEREGHRDPILVKCEFNICNLLNVYTNFQIDT